MLEYLFASELFFSSMIASSPSMIIESILSLESTSIEHTSRIKIKTSVPTEKESVVSTSDRFSSYDSLIMSSTALSSSLTKIPSRDVTTQPTIRESTLLPAFTPSSVCCRPSCTPEKQIQKGPQRACRRKSSRSFLIATGQRTLPKP